MPSAGRAVGGQRQGSGRRGVARDGDGAGVGALHVRRRADRAAGEEVADLGHRPAAGRVLGHGVLEQRRPASRRSPAAAAPRARSGRARPSGCRRPRTAACRPGRGTSVAPERPHVGWPRVASWPEATSGARYAGRAGDQARSASATRPPRRGRCRSRTASPGRRRVTRMFEGFTSRCTMPASCAAASASAAWRSSGAASSGVSGPVAARTSSESVRALDVLHHQPLLARPPRRGRRPRPRGGG